MKSRSAPSAFLRDWIVRIQNNPVVAFLWLAGGLTALRVLALFFSDANLGPDETQYWVWSQSPDWGYFSKPPLIAWAIAATTSVFGDAEWAVRLSAPLLHFGGAAFIFALARRLYGDAAGVWAGVGWIALPGVSLSSQLMTTDAPLLFFWCCALYAFFRLVSETGSRGRIWAAALGGAIGLGLLAKYAMIYFPIGAAIALIFSRDLRRAARPWNFALAGFIASAMIAPNLAWNAAHDFSTLAHTAANANWSAAALSPSNLLEFVGAQIGIFGPIMTGLLIWCVLISTRGGRPAAARGGGAEIALLAFAAVPLAIVAFQAFIARAHANWAAAAFPSLLIFATGIALRQERVIALAANAAVSLIAAGSLVLVFSNFGIADSFGFGNAVKRVRGWDVQGPIVAEVAAGYDAILVDDRELMGALLYYARGGPPVVSWNSNRRVENHYEAFMAHQPQRHKRVLFVARTPDLTGVKYDFSRIAARGQTQTALGPKRERTLYFFELSGFGEG